MRCPAHNQTTKGAADPIRPDCTGLVCQKSKQTQVHARAVNQSAILMPNLSSIKRKGRTSLEIPMQFR